MRLQELITDEEIDAQANSIQPGPYEHIDHIKLVRWALQHVFDKGKHKMFDGFCANCGDYCDYC